jgi:thiol-disulfide isomerase/thioredoxin
MTKKTEAPTALMYFSPTCGPCAVTKKAIAQDAELAARITQINADKNARAADAAKVQYVPTFVRADGARLTGGQTAKALRKWLGLPPAPTK